ncbi:Putative stomatin/prohibitin-family membrane protease subunit aq_911 [hydrothermal vent metagenome]|uniref:Stomatin/prohibitin-family membrane protease subunit aq_911 n=1 Tax=hydrothermal vent metagenome TaxID=652676 RepID=A0A3B1C1N3_9ZZZZ
MMPFIISFVFIVMLLWISIRILNEYERGVIFRLGRFWTVKEPGLRIVWPFIDRMVRMSLRLVALDVPTQDIITKDNVSVKVNAVVYFKVVDPEKAVIQVEDFFYATGQLSQTSLRSVLGQVELDELLSERDKINHELQTILDRRTDPWGIKVSNVEIKHVDLPTEMQRAMAKQAEAERERRAKIINAMGEAQAAQKLAEAASIIEKQPAALTLRYLQTIREMASEGSTNTIIPLPFDFMEPFQKAMGLKKKT